LDKARASCARPTLIGRALVLSAGTASLGLALLLAPRADLGPTSAAASPTPGSRPTATAAFKAGDCALCHSVPDVDPAPHTTSCTGCHVWIRDVAASPAKRAKALELFPHWERYEHSVATYLEVPSLDAAMARLDPAWVRRWLADPHDLRPNLPETMPRLGLDGAQLDAIADAFAAARAAVPATPAPDRSRIGRGETVFTTAGCVACHTFGGRHTLARVPLAPDLAVARDRMSPDHLAAWIADPRAVSSAATMPPSALSADDVLAVRDYLLLADPKAEAPSAATRLPPPVDRPVRWAEVEERVFGRICQHCHMNPDLNDGRAGPGNAGGFGFAATGIDLQTLNGVRAAADRIPASLARRRAEIARDHVGPGQRPATLKRPAQPGMPLGLPALSDHDTALVLAWIAQGMPE